DRRSCSSFSGDPELPAEFRHRLAGELQTASFPPSLESPPPSNREEVLPMFPVRNVTDVSGRSLPLQTSTLDATAVLFLKSYYLSIFWRLCLPSVFKTIRLVRCSATFACLFFAVSLAAQSTGPLSPPPATGPAPGAPSATAPKPAPRKA